MNVPKRTLFHGVDNHINRILKTRSYRHRTLLRHHESEPATADQGFELTQSTYAQMRDNFAAVLVNASPRRSQENWRLISPGTACDERNKAREVGLERALVAACQEVGRKDWWNQVPVASGLLNDRAGKRRAIDLVHHRGPTAYDFVELKLGSDTPVFAAVEILEYGMLWLLTRQARRKLGYSWPSLLDADDINLSVLAPTPFYGDANYHALAEGIDAALRQIGADSGVAMSMRFSQFPPDFAWTGVGNADALRRLLDSLYPGQE